ncbi:hypothetical protein SO802_024639 [Lithocarpus litseifolius]|uniref:Uncharacterized protein n=1 Tax=Lithocarpus litseifolius TaxID=425828 RepID=A0AAW2C9D8_9ROSI
MASKKFITWVGLFILMLLFASSKVESRVVAEASKLGSKSRKLAKGPVPPAAPSFPTHPGGPGDRKHRP